MPSIGIELGGWGNVALLVLFLLAVDYLRVLFKEPLRAIYMVGNDRRYTFLVQNFGDRAVDGPIRLCFTFTRARPIQGPVKAFVGPGEEPEADYKNLAGNSYSVELTLNRIRGMKTWTLELEVAKGINEFGFDVRWPRKVANSRRLLRALERIVRRESSSDPDEWVFHIDVTTSTPRQKNREVLRRPRVPRIAAVSAALACLGGYFLVAFVSRTVLLAELPPDPNFPHVYDLVLCLVLLGISYLLFRLIFQSDVEPVAAGYLHHVDVDPYQPVGDG